MLDLLLDRDGDLIISERGDLSLSHSVRQAVEVRLRWILGEWRFAPTYGFPWFEEMLVRLPNLTAIQASIRSAVMSVVGVTDCRISAVTIDPKSRTARLSFQFAVGDETYDEEMDVNV